MLTAYDVADRIVVLAGGQVVADGDPAALIRAQDPAVLPFARAALLPGFALQRLTTQTQGVPTEAWRGNPAEWESAAAAWQTWWNKNRDRYPMRFDTSGLPSLTPPVPKASPRSRGD
jgi:ABC-type sulfate/molybdate transport systems ATPase subunit